MGKLVFLIILIILIVFYLKDFNSRATIPEILRQNSTEVISILPDSLGLSGAYIGVTEGVLIVAGGSNFDKPIWEGG